MVTELLTGLFSPCSAMAPIQFPQINNYSLGITLFLAVGPNMS